jgi:hypothetical protein
VGPRGDHERAPAGRTESDPASGGEVWKEGELVVQALFEPRIFNFVIMGLYLLNAARWAYEGKWADMCYWLSALAITATVTFGYAH